MNSRDFAVLSALCNLRWLAVGCQAAIVLCAGWLGVMLPITPLWTAIGALALFNGYAIWRSRRAVRVKSMEIFLHIVVDVSVLAWLIGWGGGITNPFTSLFLLPIAFAALTLPPRWLYATALLCAAGYGVCAVLGRPFPHVHGPISDSFDLHLVGMAVNFVLSVGVVLYFFARLARNLRARDDELALLRERFARNEGIVALGTHAASVAHELNTPLGTLTLMLDDLIEHPVPASAKAELLAMRAVVDVCRDRVRELAAPATEAGENPPRVKLEHVVERWLLTRPAIELVYPNPSPAEAVPLPLVEPAVGYLLQVLLNNAADASTAAGSARIELRLVAADGALSGQIRDFGAGFSGAPGTVPSQLFASSKPTGLGVGLVLGHATVERLGGELSMQAAEGGGLQANFVLPLSAEESAK